MARIIWTRIEDAEFGHKDTNDLLFWTPDGAVIGFWQDSGPDAGNWVDLDREIINPTHYARISQPE